MSKTARRRGHCQTCNRPYQLRTDGTMPAHASRTHRYGYCAGSLNPPAEDVATQADRIPLDALTSDALDQLYDRVERLHRFRNRWAAHAGRLQDRALTAEARVRELEAEVARLTAGRAPTT
ncbi:hypothetical protein ACFY8V_32760 [Streptomyces californicus]|uniref:hypothetical protein n=1 Tax=Streptomyces californicus TaxID=67351 RepID=UPI0036A8874C